MKYKNLVVGEQVQVKHNHTEEYCGDHFEEGQVFEVLRVDSDGMFKVEGEQFDFGVGYGRPENFRKYKEPQQEPQQETGQYKVGDKVLVGAEGAGYGCVLPEYAGKVCTVVRVRVHGESNLVSITHPDVINGSKYTSMTEYLTPYKEEPEPLKVGDIVELSEDCVDYFDDCIPKGLYRLHAETGCHDGYTNLETEHGGSGQATVKTELLTKVGVCINPNG